MILCLFLVTNGRSPSSTLVWLTRQRGFLQINCTTCFVRGFIYQDSHILCFIILQLWITHCLGFFKVFGFTPQHNVQANNHCNRAPTKLHSNVISFWITPNISLRKICKKLAKEKMQSYQKKRLSNLNPKMIE